MTDKIIFSTHSDDNIALQARGIDKEWNESEAEFAVTLPMDYVTTRGTRAVGYVVRAKVYFENGAWHFSLETPAGVQVERLETSDA